MAKDILIDTNTGDFLIPDRDKKIEYFDVVWGRLFDDDGDKLYMNIVVPYNYLNKFRYDSNNECICNAHAEYCPEDKYFFVRLVSKISANGQYINLNDNSVPTPSEALYYPEYTGNPQLIKASQIQMVDKNGNLSVLFKRYGGGTYCRAILCQGGDIDFKIGDGDSQSAQLLARCAPGKYYRYPTSGVDLTKYINSVVEHTSLTSELISEFQKDYKNISEANFNISNGNLDIVFTGANEANDEGLDDPSTLDLSLFRVADDEFIRTLYKASMGVMADNIEFMNNMIEYSGRLLGIWDIGSACELEDIEYSAAVGDPNKMRISKTGLITDMNYGYKVSSVDCLAGRLYALNYAGQDLPLNVGYYVKNASGIRVWEGKWDALVMFQVKEGSGLYVGEDFYTNDYSESFEYRHQTNRRCFIPLVDCTGYYYAGSEEEDLNKAGCGLRPVSYKQGNLATILGIMVHPVTGKIYGLISSDSVIDEVRIGLKTNKLFVIKHTKE